jgi:hypothetical protein
LQQIGAGGAMCRRSGTDRKRVMAVEKIRIEQHSFMGSLWFGGWLFTLGYLQLTFWKGLLALVVWPYYLGTTFSRLAH